MARDSGFLIIMCRASAPDFLVEPLFVLDKEPGVGPWRYAIDGERSPQDIRI
jgi:hypothetical protein